MNLPPRTPTVVIAAVAAAFACTSELSAQTAYIENQHYRISLQDDRSITVTALDKGLSARFEARFEVINQQTRPSYSQQPVSGALQGASTSTNVSFSVPAWNGDPDFSNAPGTRSILTANSATIDSDSIDWSFGTGSGFSFSASVSLPDDGGEPKLAWTLNPSVTRYYSVGYIGAPASDAADISELYAPGIWMGLRFPDKAYLIDESRCALPVSLKREGDMLCGLVVDPDFVPYRLSGTSNAAFGVGIRNSSGQAQPLIYAPLYATTSSSLSAPHSFALRLIVSDETPFDCFRRLAESLYGFCDYRKNLAGGSLNDALDNLEDFILNSTGNNYSYWSENAKANDYVNDDPGYARFQSGALPLSLAMLRDSSRLYEERALPSIEYFASRKRNLFKIDGHDPDYPMGGPMSGTYVGDWAALSGLTGRRTSAFETLGKEALYSSIALENKIDSGADYSRNDTIDLTKKWLRHLVNYYRLTGEEKYLEDALSIADRFITWRYDQPPTDFRDVLTSFWSEVTGNWDIFSELYELTGIERYRDVEIQAMQEFVMRMNFAPRIPAGDVSADGSLVPAWIVSETGLISEAAATSSSHRGIFLTTYASAYLARTAAYTGDPFYAKVAKAGIIGRFLNYPGYGYRTQYSAKFQAEDYPLRYYSDYGNTAHMNHPLPMACMIVDYLIADAAYRSGGEIYFPSFQSDSGAYFHTRVYGREPGEFFGDREVWPWMPKGLLNFSGDNAVQINYIAGHGNGRLYIALSNQCQEDVSVTMQLNPDCAAWTSGGRVRVWNGPERVADAVFGNGMSVTIPANGLVSLAIDGVTPLLDLQADYIDSPPARLGTGSYYSGSASFGRNVGMIVSLSSKRQSAYVYTDASPEVLSWARLHYSVDNAEEQSLTKANYPFEFSVPLPETAASISYRIEGSNGSSSPVVTLSLALSSAPDAPQGLSATATGADSAHLAWDATGDADGYLVERMGEDEGSFHVIAELDATAYSYEDVGLSAASLYIYRVRAWNEIGVSTASSTVSLLTDSELESWRRDAFGSPQPVGYAADDADPDGDGLPNLLEYCLGSNPLAYETLLWSATASGLRFPFAARSDVIFQVLVSTDLLNWQPVAQSDQSGGISAMSGYTLELLSTGPTAEYLLHVPDVEQQTRFYRLAAY